ncbi:ABC transporter permease [Brooklawnia cerclae]|uniref:ABC-type dipeptide/oligopeptide/nickel transport system permease subunit n=1 Tax=Brooklawnia cerclae TaxID=349934 RepID=A0ABX0SE81_9ACTN|nr:ABC transporter permease subunit [Brooklawnia cerclae]NIH56698.1 ABC-type dipeptide/oligopeptide/nickel transport system permease subunit [Brooklawnia cerclae]
MSVILATLGRNIAWEESRTSGLLGRLLHHRGFVLGAAGVVVLVGVAAFGPSLVGDPDATRYSEQLLAPSLQFPLGTDSDGRDVLARTIYGARVSILASLVVFAVTTTIGICLGVGAGLIGGWVDTVVCRCCDVMLGLPSLVMALAIVGALGPGLTNLVLAMSLTGWAGLAKLCRSLSLESRHRGDVIAARMAGVSRVRTAAGHVFPSVLVYGLISATLGLGETILGLAGMSFLGLGVQPPTAEWGSMLNESRIDLSVAPWLLIGPGVGLVVVVTSVTLISDALRDCADLREFS